jgi:hypothetical protein
VEDPEIGISGESRDTAAVTGRAQPLSNRVALA